MIRRIHYLCVWLFCCLLLCTQMAFAQSDSINVATYNLRFDTPQDGVNAWPNRREAVKALIRYHEFDLFGTQELLAHQIADLEGLSEYAHVGAGRDDGPRTLQARVRRRAGRGRVVALPLQQVGPVEAGGGDGDQDLAGPGDGVGHLGPGEHLRTARFGNRHGIHAA